MHPIRTRRKIRSRFRGGPEGCRGAVAQKARLHGFFRCDMLPDDPFTNDDVYPEMERPSPLCQSKVHGFRPEILVDTKEKMPWTFDPQRFDMTVKNLRTGDYSIAGLEDRVAIERKTLGDFVNTVIHNWIRFRKELVRLSSFDVAAIVVEADLNAVALHQYESDASPASVLGRMNGIFLDHGVPVFMWGDRVLASQMAGALLALAWRKLS